MGFRQQKVKQEHAILPKARELLDAVARAPGVSRVIPGRIKAAHGAARPFYCTLQYRTADGFKLLVHSGGTQEVFVVSNDPDRTEAWLKENLPPQRSE